MKVSGSLIADGDVIGFKWALNSSGIAHKADQNTDQVLELFGTSPGGSDRIRLSGSLAAGGNVFEFEWVP